MTLDTPPSRAWQEYDGDAPQKFNVRLSADLRDRVEDLVDAGVYTSFPEAARDGVRRVVKDPSNTHVPGATCGNVGEHETVRLTPQLVSAVTGLVEDDLYPSRTDAVRDGLHRVVDDVSELDHGRPTAPGVAD